jgi:hypothetical protein
VRYRVGVQKIPVFFNPVDPFIAALAHRRDVLTQKEASAVKLLNKNIAIINKIVYIYSQRF